MKILLVDDSGTMRAIQKRSFLKLGISEDALVEAADGQAGFDHFQAGGLDIIFTDWNMPIMNGLEFLKKIRESDQQIPVIMVTTEAERSRVLEAIQAGVSDYLVKPFTPDDLKAKIEKWLPALCQ